MHVSIANLLYADDAAIPADSPEDLVAFAAAVGCFCNDMHLFISTAKNFISAFQHDSDPGVVYDGESVWVDGSKIEMYIWEFFFVASSYKPKKFRAGFVTYVAFRLRSLTQFECIERLRSESYKSIYFQISNYIIPCCRIWCIICINFKKTMFFTF